MPSTPLAKIFRNRLGDWREPAFTQETIGQYSKNKDIPNITAGSLAGIEFEIEKCDTHHLVDQYPREAARIFNSLWNITHDGSLRNNGLEFITKPLSGNNLSFALQMLDNYTKAVYPECRPSGRTGIHVHVNALDINTAQLFAWISLYQIFEKQLYRLSGGRDKNLFCLPTWAWDGNIKSAIQYFVLRKDDGVSAANQLAGQGLKYAGLNTRTLQEHGTLEFRQMHTTRDMAKIAQWADMLIRIKKSAVSQVTEMESLIKFWEKLSELNTNSEYYQLMHQVFGDARPLLEMQGYDSDMAAGVIQVKECLITYQRALKNPPKEVPAAQPPPQRNIFRGPSRRDYEIAIEQARTQIIRYELTLAAERHGRNDPARIHDLTLQIDQQRSRIITWQGVIAEMPDQPVAG